MGFVMGMQDWLGIQKTTDVIHQISRLNGKKVIINQCRKAFVKIQHTFMIKKKKKTLRKVGIKDNFPNMIKNIWKTNKQTNKMCSISIILNGNRWMLSPKIKIVERCCYGMNMCHLQNSLKFNTQYGSIERWSLYELTGSWGLCLYEWFIIRDNW